MKNHLYKISLLLAFSIGILLRFINIGNSQLWRDEAFSANVAKLSVREIIEIAIKDTQPPLHLLLSHYWIEIFSDSEFSLRIISFIFGVLTLIAIYKIADSYFQQKLYVLLALLFAVFNPFLILYSKEARAYSMFIFFSTASVYFAMQINKNNSLFNHLGFVLFSILGLYTHNLFVIIIIAFALIRLYEILFIKKVSLKEIILFKSRYVNKIIFEFILIFILFIPWLIFLISQYIELDNQGFWMEFHPLNDLIRNVPILYSGENDNVDISIINIILVLIIKVIGLLFSGIGIFFELKQTKRTPFLSIFSVTTLVIIYIISFKTPFFYFRYLLFVIPILLLVMTYGLSKAEKFISRKFVLLVSAIYIISSIIYFTTDLARFKDRSDYKYLITQIEYNPENDLILHPSATSFHSFNYYSNMPNYIYDKDRKIPIYEGIAYLDEKDYYDGQLTDYKRIWVLYYLNKNNISQELDSLGFEKVDVIIIDKELTLESWKLIEN